MLKLFLKLMLIAALMLVWRETGYTQQPNFGPAVSSYLIGLDEEFKELDFQLRHREISRNNHAKARLRLQIVRRFVEQLASEREEDRVPEIEVLAAEEIGALGLANKPALAELRVGSLFGERWKLLGIETGRPQLFVFERLPSTETAALDKDPLSVIETVIVAEPVTPSLPPEVTTEQAPPKSMPAEPEPAGAPVAQIEGPQVLRIFLPGYSQQARAKGVEGELHVSAVFRHDGKIKDIVVEQSLGHGLDERARDSVRRAEFEPAKLEQQPIDVRAIIVFNFTLMKVTVRVGAAERVSEAKQ